MSSKADFLKCGQRRRDTFKSGEFSFNCQSMTDRERAEYETLFLDEEGNFDSEKLKESRRFLIQKCVCDDDWNLMFTAADHEALGEVDGGFTGELQTFLRNLCRLDVKKNDAEDARKK